MSAELPPGQPEHSALERRYRRLLALYPASWRARHDEEVLAVLLECAPPGRARPGWRDAADLIGHALAERARRAGRSPTRDDTRSGFALAGIVALAVLAAVSVLQLIALVPNAAVWASGGGATFNPGAGYLTEPSGAPIVALAASAACLIACACWVARLRRGALIAIALTDAGFLLAALLLRNGLYTVSWPLIMVILGLAAVATVLIVHRGVSAAGRELIGARGGIELIGAVVLAAEIAGWQHLAWADSVYGSPSDYAIPRTLVIAFLAAAVVALAMARRNPVPLVAITVLSPLLLVFGFVPIAQALLGDADVSIGLADDAVPLGVVAFLAFASLVALRRSRSRALG